MATTTFVDKVTVIEADWLNDVDALVYGPSVIPSTLSVVGITTVGANIVSDTDSTDDLGTTGVRWANLWVDDITVTASITTGGNILSDTDSTDDLGTTGVRWANLFVDDITLTTALTAGGVITGLTLEATGDISAGDDAAIGYTAGGGISITGQGTTTDFQVLNDAKAKVISIRTGTTDTDFEGTLFLKEVAAASDDVADYGQLWAKTDNTVWFTTKAGVDIQLGGGMALKSEAFTSSGTWDFSAAGSPEFVWYDLVASGAGGANQTGGAACGGGGGGECLLNRILLVTQDLTITIGAGGAGGANSGNNDGAVGNNSTVAGGDVTITAYRGRQGTSTVGGNGGGRGDQEFTTAHLGSGGPDAAGTIGRMGGPHPSGGGSGGDSGAIGGPGPIGDGGAGPGAAQAGGGGGSYGPGGAGVNTGSTVGVAGQKGGGGGASANDGGGGTGGPGHCVIYWLG